MKIHRENRPVLIRAILDFNLSLMFACFNFGKCMYYLSEATLDSECFDICENS